MATPSRSVVRLLERHKPEISQEIANSNIVQHLTKKGVFTPEEGHMLNECNNSAISGEIFVDLIAKKGFNAFRELCVTLELESPQLLTALLLDSTDTVAEGTSSAFHTRESSVVSGSFPFAQKCNNSDRLPTSLTNLADFESESGSPNKVRNKLMLDDLHELLEEPVEELQGNERIVWEYHNVQLSRVPGYGFGIAVSGGRDNPHFTNGDPSIAISDVLKAGPAEGKLLINDRVITANGISLENVDYATAVQVLRDSGQTVALVVKRRVILPASPEPQKLHVSLSRNKKKEDFGVILGCKIYIKEIVGRSVAGKDGMLQEGDMIYKINSTPIEGLTLKEARKMVENSKDKLDLVVKRESGTSGKKILNGNIASKGDPFFDEVTKNNYAPPHNVYVTPPGGAHRLYDEKNNLQKQQMEPPPPRPPLPNEDGCSELSESGTLPIQSSHEGTAEGNTTTTNNNHESEYGHRRLSTNEETASISERNKGNLPDPRFISFQKSGSVGIRLTGGNEVGIFVTAVQPGSPAAAQGLQPGDKILKVNDMDMKGVTREEAVLYLLSLQDQINLIAQFRKEEYDQIVSLQRGDSFYIKAHFNNDAPEKLEMPFRKSDVFHVVDTLHNGVVGSWQVFKMDPFLSGLGQAAEQVTKGVIPNKARAEEIATQQFNAAKKEQNSAEQSKSSGSFFRRKKEKSHRRSKSLGKDHWEDLVWSESMSKFPAYERVSLRHPGFPRPVVIFGPVADIARERLLRDFPLKFAFPQQDTSSDDVPKASKSGIVRLSAIRQIMDRGKHALLDVTPNAVDKLNYAQFYPIVIFAKADSKQSIKECRSGLPKKAHLSSKKLLEQCQKLEKLWSHIFTGTITLTDDNWYNKLTDLVDKQQSAPIWMSETKPEENLSDDFLFPMTSRLSYSSSPESDGEFCEDTMTPRRNSRNLSLEPRMTRSNSDPSLHRQEGTIKSEMIPDYNAPPPYAMTLQPQPQQQQDDPVTKRRSHGGDSKYGFSRKTELSLNESHDDLPLPPQPASMPPDTRAQSQPPSRISPPKSSNGESPPKIDRLKKPSRRSATERLFGNSLDRSAHLRDMKMSTYDSTSSNSNVFDDGPDLSNGNGGPRSLGPYATPPGHETPGYRGTRSMYGYESSPSSKYSTPPSMTNSNHQNGINGADRYRYSDYKPAPPPKTTPYKPVPPPKPKSYPRTQSQPPSMEGNYMNSGPQSMMNGHSEHTQSNHYLSNKAYQDNNHYSYSNGHGRYGPVDDGDSNGFDSGQGSSLDRDYSVYNGDGRYAKPPPPNHNRGPPPMTNHSRGQYYYNLPSARVPNGTSPRRNGDGLDLTNREYRGSAFELYKKPGHPHYSQAPGR